MVQQPAEARSLGGVEAPQLSRDAVHEPFMFVLKTKILQDSPRRCLKEKHLELQIWISLGVGIQVGINRRLYYKIGEYLKFTRNTGFVFLIGRAKKRARKDIKVVRVRR